MTQSIFSTIKRPTLLLDESQARKNIQKMSEKARAQDIQFRPHFKTHQSAEIGTWFREAGVKKITVSSVSMADYFARNGWRDITIAFPVNWREIDEINRIADHTHLELLVESIDSAHFLQDHVRLLTEVWIKVDVGSHRAGIWWEETGKIMELVDVILKCDKLILRGFMTHNGLTYHAGSVDEIIKIHRQSIQNLTSLSRMYQEKQHSATGISIGDTPACWLSEDFSGVDEIRPGNFIFFDVWQYQLGVCDIDEIAVAVACPVVAKHNERREVIIYCGAVHLSKEFILKHGDAIYGLVAHPEKERWGQPLEGCFVSSLSQEHGILKLSPQAFDTVKVGELVCILPIHSCLAADALGHYLTLAGRRIATMKEEYHP